MFKPPVLFAITKHDDVITLTFVRRIYLEVDLGISYRDKAGNKNVNPFCRACLMP